MQLQFKDIDLSSKSTIEKYTMPWNIENGEFTFTNMFIWGTESKMQYAEAEGFLFVKLEFPEEKIFFWPPVPENEDRLKEYKTAIKISEEYFAQRGIVPYFRSVSQPFKAWFEEFAPQYELVENRDNFEYVYLSEKMISLKGKKLHSKRNFINRIRLNYPQLKYESLTKENIDECMALYDRWHKTHFAETIDRFDERGSVLMALENMDALGLTGGIIRIDGAVKAFTVGEKKLPTMSQIHIEKADNDIDGLYQIINQQYAEHNCADTMYINREEDMGEEGMRKAKLSYYPDRMIEKYDAVYKVKEKSCIFMCGEKCEFAKI